MLSKLDGLWIFELIILYPNITKSQFNLRCCPALLDKAKAKTEALAAVRNGDTQSSKSGTGSPEAKRQRISPQENGDAEAGTAEGQGKKTTEQNKAEPFKPPYVDELYVGCLEGLEGEEGMSILVRVLVEDCAIGLSAVMEGG